MVRRAFAVVLAFACVACGAADERTGASPTTAPIAVTTAPRPTTPLPTGSRLEDLAAQFAYDASAPIVMVERGSSTDGALTIHDIEFASPKGGRARAYLITPATSGRVPGMVFVAGSNQRREDLRMEAQDVARRGVIALVLEQSQVAASRSQLWTFTPQDREEAIQTVVDARHAIDVLTARTDVDHARIGFYGFSYGAWLGAIAAAVDRRVGLVVLRSGGPQILAEIARASSRTLTPDYQALMATVDQMSYAPAIAVPALVQNGTRDPTFTAEQVRAWQDRIGGVKTVKTYDAAHTLDAAASADVLTWIAARWQLP